MSTQDQFGNQLQNNHLLFENNAWFSALLLSIVFLTMANNCKSANKLDSKSHNEGERGTERSLLGVVTNSFDWFKGEHHKLGVREVGIWYQARDTSWQLHEE